jgi:hypothetical protein
MTVVHQANPDKYEVVQTIQTMTGARTMTIDPATHALYTVGARYGAPPTEATKENPRRRPPMVPGSVTVLELAP